MLVFAIERADGDYQTAELLLGKFDIKVDEAGASFAVPAFAGKARVSGPRARARVKSGSDIEWRGEAGRPGRRGSARAVGLPAVPARARPRRVRRPRVAPWRTGGRRAPRVSRPGPSPLRATSGRPMAMEQRGDGRLDAGRRGQHHRRRDRGGGTGRGDVERRTKLHDQLLGRRGRRQCDPPERPVRSLRMEHLHVGRRRDRLRQSRRRRSKPVAGRKLLHHHARRGVAASACCTSTAGTRS